MSRRRIFNIIKIIFVVYCLIGIGVKYFQDMILFHPEKKFRNEKFNTNLPHKEVNIHFNASSNMNVVEFFASDTTHIKGVVLYFHGNRKNIDWYATYAPNFTKNNYEVWMIDYPGFGKSTGPLTEQRLYEYATQLYKLARSRFAKDNIIIYGKSMGTGIAAQLASVKDCKALVLETPYNSLTSLVGNYLFMYPLKNILHYNFPTFEYLPKVDAPITIFHGTSDGVIPYSNAQKLKQVLKEKDEFITIEGGEHNNLNDYPLFHQKLNAILQ